MVDFPRVDAPKIVQTTKIRWTIFVYGNYQAQPALGVIGNIAFTSSRNKGKIISPPFTEDDFTRSPPVAQ